VARKGGASQSSLLDPDLRRTPDPYTYQPRAPKKTRQVPWEGSGPPLSKVHVLARSRDGKNPGIRDGDPVLACVQALSYASRYWRKACDISQWAKPVVKPTKPCSLCIYCRKDVPPATTLTGDVSSQHLIRHIQSNGRRRQGHPTGDASDRFVGKQCPCAERRTILIIPCTRSYPCTPRIRRSRVSGH
jgi:hypothetical protein